MCKDGPTPTHQVIQTSLTIQQYYSTQFITMLEQMMK